VASSHRDTRVHKREQFSGGPQKKNNRIILIIASVGLALIGLLYLQSTSKSSTGKVHASMVKASGGFIAIPLADLNNGLAKFLDYTTVNGKAIQIFAIKSSDGVYRAAANACDVCYRSKMGYHQEGDDMVCNKCGRHFPSKDVNVITGGCNPDGVPATVQGDKLVIATADLDPRTELF